MKNTMQIYEVRSRGYSLKKFSPPYHRRPGLQFSGVCAILILHNALMEKVSAETDAAERVVTG